MYAVLDASVMLKSEFHSGCSMIYQYILQLWLRVIGVIMYHKLQNETKECRKVQEKLLLKILRKNKATAYGKEHKFESITTREEFVKRVPFSISSDYESYIERISKGEKKILTHETPVLLAVTSGTSGKCSLLPITKDVFNTFFKYGIAVLSHCMVNEFPKVRQLQKILKFFYVPKHRQSESKIPIGPNSSSPKKSTTMLPLYTTPASGFDIPTEPEALYVHLLFALKDRNLGIIEANFASLVCHGFTALRHQWHNLVDDIRYGRVNNNLPIASTIRIQLDEILKPDPKRAKELEEEFTVGFDGIATRIWPNLNLVLTTDTGSFKFYGRALKNFYTKGANHYSPLYAATEGLIGVNIWPQNYLSLYLLVPNSMFYEFIPILEADQKNPRTLFAEQLKEGEIYEVVVTNSSGLSRYRIGDVIRMIRFHNQTPVVEFLYRQGQLLNVRGEKLDEHIFYEALLETVAKWEGFNLVDYCCAESILSEQLPDSPGDTYLPHYMVFIEFEDGKVLDDDQKKQLDETLCSRHWVYGSFRTKGSISPAQLFCVAKGTFEKLREFWLDTIVYSPNQIKIPRVLHNEDALKLLMDNSQL